MEGLVDRPFVYTCFFPHHQTQVQGNKKEKKKKKKPKKKTLNRKITEMVLHVSLPLKSYLGN